MDYQGNIIGDTLEGNVKRDVVFSLRQKGLIPIQIKRVKENVKLGELQFFSQIGPKDLSIFCRQYASLLKSGIPPVQGLYMLINQTHNAFFRKSLKRVYLLIQRGYSISAAMIQEDGRFPIILIRTIESGEWSGTLDNSLERMAYYFERQYRLKQKVLKALAYPMLLILASIGVLIFLVNIVIPQITSLLNRSQTQLPRYTLILLNIYRWANSNLWFIILFFGLFILIIQFSLAMEKYRIFLHSLVLKVPILNRLVIRIVSSRFYRTMAILNSVGLPITQSIDISLKCLGNDYIKSRLNQALILINQGKGLARSLRGIGLFPEETINIISIGEESGRLGEMMEKLGDICELEAETAIDRFISLLEPLSVIFIGGIIAFIIISMIMPMFQMYSF